jgi:Ig-like domain CHU_C associated/Secretion system C-terminal sorting domain
VTIDNSESGILYSLKINEIQIGQTLVGTGSKINFIIPRDSLKSGSNPFSVRAQSATCPDAGYNQKDSIQVFDTYPVRQVASTTSCESGSVTLTANGAPANGHYNWYLQNDSVPIPEQSASTLITPVLKETTEYYVAVVNSLGCEGQRALIAATIVNYDEALIIQVDNGTLQSNFSTGNRWYLNGTLLPDTSETLKIKSSGQYSLNVKIGNCITTDEKIVLITELESNPDFKAYPNPVTTIFFVEIPDEQNQIKDPFIVNAFGEQIGSMKLINEGTTKKGQFYFTGFPAGIYFIRIISGGIAVIKVAKE